MAGHPRPQVLRSHEAHGRPGLGLIPPPARDSPSTTPRYGATELIDPEIAAHKGRIVKTTGDGLLAEFASVVDAVAGAAAIQRVMAERNKDVPGDSRIEFRIGVNLGDIIIDGDDIYGDGVNIHEADAEILTLPRQVDRSSSAHLPKR